MSIAELSTSAFGSVSEGPAPEERVPPQDVDAEQSVLGGMLLSKDAIADVVEALRGTDFYRPAHETDLRRDPRPLRPRRAGRRRSPSPPSCSKRGELAAHRRRGLPPHAHRVGARPRPTPATTPRSSRERAILRRLVEAGTRIVQLGYAQGEGDVDDIVDAAQAEVYAVTDKRGGEDYAPLGDDHGGRPSTRSRRLGNRDGEMIGVPTGFADLDELTNGLHPGQMIVVAARPADRQVDPRPRHLPGRRRSSTTWPACIFSPRDEPHRDHHAPALGRGADPAAAHAQRAR